MLVQCSSLVESSMYTSIHGPIFGMWCALTGGLPSSIEWFSCFIKVCLYSFYVVTTVFCLRVYRLHFDQILGLRSCFTRYFRYLPCFKTCNNINAINFIYNTTFASFKLFLHIGINNLRCIFYPLYMFAYQLKIITYYCLILDLVCGIQIQGRLYHKWVPLLSVYRSVI